MASHLGVLLNVPCVGVAKTHSCCCVFYYSEFGLASHLGVLLNVPCVGVAKTLIHVEGLENDDTHKGRVSIYNIFTINNIVLFIDLFEAFHLIKQM